MQNNHRHVCLALFLWCSLGLPGVLSSAEGITIAGKTMGTTYSVKLPTLPADLSQEFLQSEIDRCLDTVNRQMSTWLPDSELSRFNQYRETDWFPVSRNTAHVVETALEVSEQTGGAFDVTVGPLVNLWSFGPDRTDHALPSPKEIEDAKARVGYRFLSVQDDPPALRKSRPDVSVDLSAIAKGFGVDQVAFVLEKHSIADYMVEIGGEVRAKGTKPDGTPWRIGIETPTPFARGIQKTVALSGQALATSGDYRNFIVIEGKRYSHTIDPRTGWPVGHELTSVSVIAENCMLADAYATALMVLGPDDGYNWAKEQGLAALLIVRDQGQFLEKPTPAFAQLLPARKESTMTTTWLIAAGVFFIAVLLMSVGAIFRNRSIAGSCGGLAGMKDDKGRTLCEACTNPAPECQGQEDAESRLADEPESEKV